MPFQVDIIVNSAGPNLCVANAGTVTTSLLTAAGDGATSCLNDYPKPVPVGDVVIGDPGKLACKKIMHVVLAKYNQSREDECIKVNKHITTGLCTCFIHVLIWQSAFTLCVHSSGCAEVIQIIFVS